MLTRGGIAANLEKHRGEGSCEYKFQCKSLLTSPSMDISQDFLHQHKHRFIYSGGDGFAALSGSCQGASLYFFFFGESHCHFDPPWVLLSWNCSSWWEGCQVSGGVGSSGMHSSLINQQGNSLPKPCSVTCASDRGSPQTNHCQELPELVIEIFLWAGIYPLNWAEKIYK